MAVEYCRKVNGPILALTPHMVKRPDVYKCDALGNLIPDAKPAPEGEDEPAPAPKKSRKRAAIAPKVEDNGTADSAE